jgi:predicted GNAT family acetyltransferase
MIIHHQTQNSAATNLYKSLGFREVEKYAGNVLSKDISYMELEHEF